MVVENAFKQHLIDKFTVQANDLIQIIEGVRDVAYEINFNELRR